MFTYIFLKSIKDSYYGGFTELFLRVSMSIICCPCTCILDLILSPVELIALIICLITFKIKKIKDKRREEEIRRIRENRFKNEWGNN